MQTFLETTWKGSTIEMKFRLGNSFKDDIVVEAELVVTSKRVASKMSRRYNVSVYVERSVLVPNDTRLLDSRAFPRRANVEFGLNVTRALKMWSSTSARTHILQVNLCIPYLNFVGNNVCLTYRRYGTVMQSFYF